MRPDHATVVVRERSIGEVYDLALALARRHAGRLALLAAVGVAPWCVLDWWLLRDAGASAWYWAFVLLAAQAPLATAPLTAFLGAALFDDAPRARPALRAALVRAPALIALALLRGAAAMTIIGLACAPPHAAEALLLERQPLRGAWSRAWSLLGAWLAEHLLHLLVGALALAATVAVAQASALQVFGTFTWGHGGDEADLADRLMPIGDPWALVALWSAIAWLAVARFCAYIDLRTRLEGWDIEVELRNAGRRVEAAA